MKRLAYLTIPVIFLSLAGCGGQEKGFEDNASVRIQKAINEVNRILLDAPNGWVMQYFPQTDEWGGFNMHIMFNEDMTADIRLLEDVYGIPPEVYETSGNYEVKNDQSIIVTFNTGNNALHYFIFRGRGLGLKADYEFLVKTWEQDHILLKGKKYGFYADLLALPPGETEAGYREKIDRSRENIEYPGYKLHVRDKTYKIVTNFHKRQLFYVSGTQLTLLPYINTDGGIKLYSAATVNGVEFSELSYDGSGKFTDARGYVELEKFIPDNYEIFADGLAWYFTAADGMISDSFREEWNKQSNSRATPKYFYFCKDNLLQPQLGTNNLWNSSGVIYTLELKLTLVKMAEDKVNMKYKALSGYESVFNQANFPTIIDTFFGLPIGSDPDSPDYNGRTYRITLDNPLNPETITLTADDDPGYWFKLTVYKTEV